MQIVSRQRSTCPAVEFPEVLTPLPPALRSRRCSSEHSPMQPTCPATEEGFAGDLVRPARSLPTMSSKARTPPRTPPPLWRREVGQLPLPARKSPRTPISRPDQLLRPTARAAESGPRSSTVVHSLRPDGLRNGDGRSRTVVNEVLWLPPWHRREAANDPLAACRRSETLPGRPTPTVGELTLRSHLGAPGRPQSCELILASSATVGQR